MANCLRCGSPFKEIDYYGDRLTGCIKCNVWEGKQLLIQLQEEDLEALRAEETVDDGAIRACH